VEAADAHHVLARLLGRGADLDLASARLERARELVEVAVDLPHRAHPYLVRLLAQRLDVLELRPGVEPVRAQAGDGELDRLLDVVVGELAPRDLAEALRRLGELGQGITSSAR
jgi:hypothetical protein